MWQIILICVASIRLFCCFQRFRAPESHRSCLVFIVLLVQLNTPTSKVSEQCCVTSQMLHTFINHRGRVWWQTVGKGGSLPLTKKHFTPSKHDFWRSRVSSLEWSPIMQPDPPWSLRIYLLLLHLSLMTVGKTWLRSCGHFLKPHHILLLHIHFVVCTLQFADNCKTCSMREADFRTSGKTDL